jgi:hypothetical protein
VLFLLNDVVLNLAPKTLTPPMPAKKFSALGLTHVMQLGRELFAREPLLPAHATDQARKLAVLLVAKAPQVNAALFVAPGRDCDPDAVAVRLATIDLGVMAALNERQETGRMSATVADREVWGRKAA